MRIFHIHISPTRLACMRCYQRNSMAAILPSRRRCQAFAIRHRTSRIDTTADGDPKACRTCRITQFKRWSRQVDRYALRFKSIGVLLRAFLILAKILATIVPPKIRRPKIADSSRPSRKRVKIATGAVIHFAIAPCNRVGHAYGDFSRCSPCLLRINQIRQIKQWRGLLPRQRVPRLFVE